MNHAKVKRIALPERLAALVALEEGSPVGYIGTTAALADKPYGGVAAVRLGTVPSDCLHGNEAAPVVIDHDGRGTAVGLDAARNLCAALSAAIKIAEGE